MLWQDWTQPNQHSFISDTSYDSYHCGTVDPKQETENCHIVSPAKSALRRRFTFEDCS